MDLYKGKRLSVEKNDFKLPNGKTKQGIVVRPGNAVAILPIEGDNCYLIKQYRFPISDYIYEAPAGTCEEGEKPIETAYRELIEETGFAAEKLTPRGFIHTTPGFSDEKIFLFEAEGLSTSDEFEMDDDEIIETEKISISEMLEMIYDGRISDAKTISLAMRCFRDRI